MVQGFQHKAPDHFVMKSGSPGNAFRFHNQINKQDTRTNFNDSHSSDAKAKIRQAQGDMKYAPHQGKGRLAKAKSSVSKAVSRGGTATT